MPSAFRAKLERDRLRARRVVRLPGEIEANG
jgi:hypothetical protein